MKHGFTLLEVLLSITVIAFICGLIIGFARLANHNARRHQTRADLALWHDALQRWHDRFGEYPLPCDDAAFTNGIPVIDLFTHNELILDIDRFFYEQTGTTTNRAATSLIYLNLKDPWGMDYRYRTDNPDTFTLWSSGPDSKPGTGDDIHLMP